MGRVFKILLIVAALYFGLQAMLGESPFREPEERQPNLLQRTEERVRSEMDHGAERREALLPD